MSDNQSAEFIGCYGNNEVLTPNIDYLSRTGKLFSSAFCTNAMCSPCRASVLTGLMPSAHGIHNWLDDNLEKFWPDKWNAIGEFENFPGRLKEAGYTNALIGKHHLGKAKNSPHSFDHWVTFPHGHTKSFYDNKIIDKVSYQQIKGELKDASEPGINIKAKMTVLGEGCRGHLGKQVISKFNLSDGKDPQHYGIGFKEVWKIDPKVHEEGLVIHTNGWPTPDIAAGSYFYHGENNEAYIGFVIPLDYENPHLSPFDEFQRWKTHPVIKKYLKNGERISYGARALIKGGLQSLPKMDFPGGLLIGCNAGTLVFSKIKGSHTAMKSGELAGEHAFSSIQGNVTTDYDSKIRESWIYDELYKSRNFGPIFHKFGALLGAAVNVIDQFIFRGNMPFTMKHSTPDHACLKKADEMPKITYQKPDGIYSFDKLSSVYLSNTNHEEDQPCHLQLKDPSIPISINLPMYDEPAQRYCPAGVYEVVEKDNQKKFVINAQNCVHCKTCDIKDPSQNITWVSPEGPGGPNYPNM